LRFSPGHVWVRAEGGEAVIGLSDYIQDQMGDITTLELPDVGDVIRATRPIGKVESEDASSSIDAPVSGEVVDVNTDALASPEVVNSDPYSEGWLLRVRMEDPGELDDLISEEEYAELTMEV
jgi:glycine cleavage system H protein